ncbi:MAG: M2 family metallopeptidase [Candidatus Marinimicrobia bacterium]|nr:M2 family metallopeptidase [Candidatus Neomarinimicrobiota bacterium]
MKYVLVSVAAILLVVACSRRDPALVREAQAFIDQYTAQYLELQYVSAEAEWQSNTRIIEGDTTNAARTNRANESLAAFTGSVDNIAQAQKYLQSKGALEPLQVKQLEAILYAAANNPATVADLVKERIAAETAQVEALYGFDFQLDGQTVSTNHLDRLLWESDDINERRAAWEASKEVGRGLKAGLGNLVRLRNATVQSLGYSDYFQYQVSDYGLTTAEMIELMDKFNRELRPLYRELHTYFRYHLARKYGQPVPDLLPAHWLPNRWGQDWTQLVKVEGLDLDAALAGRDPEWLVRQAERFYISLGYSALPESFYELSSLYPLPSGATYKKNNHASAWHMDLENDIRSLMSVEPNASWYETTHHELGHIYYFMAYTNPDVPPLLRDGANRGYHEAIGSLMGLAAMQQPFVESIGLIEAGAPVDRIQTLLKEALNYVVFIPWSCGVMTYFEHELYAQPLPGEQYNRRWWDLKARFQGIAPPAQRGEEYCDAASKTHINNDAAQYYDYAISNILLFQLHDHIATEILGQDPHATNYFGSREVGEFLWSILETGAAADWRTLLKEKTGEDMSARAMLAYFQPLLEWLQAQNLGREHTLPEL